MKIKIFMVLLLKQHGSDLAYVDSLKYKAYKFWVSRNLFLLLQQHVKSNNFLAVLEYKGNNPVINN